MQKVEQDARFASDLGLKPGQWPMLITVDGKDWLRGSAEHRDGELVSVEYYRPSNSGAVNRLTIFND